MHTRRESLRRLGLLGFSLAGASGLLAACGGDGASENEDAATTGSATTTSIEADPSTSATVAAEEGATITFAGPQGELTAAFATRKDPTAGLLVIHENRGLTAYFRDLLNRFAGEGYAALSVDLLSAEGGTDALADPGAGPAALSAAPLDRLVGDLVSGLDELERRVPERPLGTVGFCFGGGMVWSLLATGEQRLAAAAPFSGPAPNPADLSEAEAATLAVYAELDARVNASRDQAEAALAPAGYDEVAAGEANQALLDRFAQHLT